LGLSSTHSGHRQHSEAGFDFSDFLVFSFFDIFQSCLEIAAEMVYFLPDVSKPVASESFLGMFSEFGAAGSESCHVTDSVRGRTHKNMSFHENFKLPLVNATPELPTRTSVGQGGDRRVPAGSPPSNGATQVQ
jgi:hypothetical protein